MFDHSRQRRTRVSELAFIEIWEVFRVRLPILVNTAVHAFIAAIAIKENAIVLRTVV